MRTQPTAGRAPQSGFTLVEMAIVIAIAGLILVGILPLLQGRKSGAELTTTRNNQEAIMVALATFAQRNGRIPCPADPTLAEGNAAFGTELISCQTGVNLPQSAEGIVPYRDLGLQQATVRDAWGRYMTYRVSPVFTPATNTNAAGAAVPNADARCRTDSTSVPPTPWIVSGTAVNPPKARFCCPATTAPFPNTTDIVIQDGAGVQISPAARTATAAVPNNLAAVGGASATTAVAAIVISHGRNGWGAFLANGNAAPTNRLGRTGGGYVNVGTGGPGANEVTNGTEGAVTKIDTQYTEATATYFDDIVSWKTQEQLFAFLGRQSCAAP
jgi:prepilin-type N-terminal cleavage/methylation domain-containing protein